MELDDLALDEEIGVATQPLSTMQPALSHTVGLH